MDPVSTKGPFFADTRECSAGADRAGKAVDLALGLAPDFGAGCLNVSVAVGGVVELIGPDRAFRLSLCQLAGKPA